MCLLLVALTLGLYPGVANAQDFRGGVVGKVTDESGECCRVSRSRSRAVTRMSTARPSQTSQGAYTPGLTPGPYRASAELQGFKKVQRENVEVRVGDRLEIDFKMEVGGLTEVVNVAAETPLLET